MWDVSKGNQYNIIALSMYMHETMRDSVDIILLGSSNNIVNEIITYYIILCNIMYTVYYRYLYIYYI